MIKKLQAALEQKYGGILGSKNKIYEEVAAAYGNLITSEEQIPAIVAGVEPMLKSFQSVQDKIRSLESKPKEEPTPQPSDPANNPEPKPEPTPQPDFKAMLAEALANVVNPLKEEIATMKSKQIAENAVNSTKDYLYKWDWANGYPELRDETWEEVMERYEESGSKWTADELKAKTTAIFNRKVAKKGVTDTTQPFKSDGGGGSTEESNKAFADEIRNALGLGKE